MALKNFNLKASHVTPLDTASGQALAKMLGAIPTAKEVQHLPISLLDAHPLQEKSYSMNEDELDWLTQNIAQNGVMEPIHVMPAQEGRYTIIVGHRRTEASRRAGKLEIPAIIETLDADQAIIMFDSTNLGQRKKLLPSERAAAYLRLESAMQNKGTDFKSTSLVSQVTGDNVRMIQRYKQLAKLSPTLLDKVDSEKMSMSTGVKLSSLSQDSQAVISNLMEQESMESLGAAQLDALITLHNLHRDTPSQIHNVLVPPPAKKKAAQTIKLRLSLFAPYLPANSTTREIEQLFLQWARQHKEAENS